MWKKFKKSMWYPVIMLAALAGIVYGIYMVATSSSSSSSSSNVKTTEDTSSGFVDRARDWWASVSDVSEEGGSLWEEASATLQEQAQAVKTWLGVG
jgi:hypothetical protein